MADVRRLLDAVIERGSEADFSAWAASGRDGLLVLRDELTGRSRGRWEGVHPKDVIDGLSAAAAAIAAEHPAEFLETFADPGFDEDGFVLTGLGRIDDERATERLANAAASDSNWIRMDAAIGLGRRPSARAVEALLRLLEDPDDLVRYHTVRSLGAIGDERAARALRGFDAPTKYEKDLAADAVLKIESRIRENGQ